MSRDVAREVADRQRYGFEEYRTRKRLEAAERLEELLVAAQRVIVDLRGQAGESGQVAASDTAHARVYWLRKQLGYLVADLGVGLPPHWTTKVVEQEYAKLLSTNEEGKS